MLLRSKNIVMPNQPLNARSRKLRNTDAAAIDDAMHSTRLGGLDFLRALAVSFVIFGHAIEGRLDNFAALSGLGVKIFFVLSGFLITRLLLDEYAAQGRIGFLAFYRRRVARLMPVFYLFLVVGVSIVWLRQRPIPWAPVLSSMLYITNYYQAFTGAEANLVSHCWSLAVEEQFYFLWPVLLLFLLRHRVSLVHALLAIVLAVWCWRWALLGASSLSIDYLYRALDTRADDLAIGCLLAVLVRSATWREKLAAVVRVPGLAWVLILGLFLLNMHESSGAILKYGFAFMVEPLVIAFLVLMSVLVSRQSGWLPSLINNSFVVYVGQVSYCMYLFHGLIGYTAARVVAGYGGNFWLGVVAEFAAIIAFSSVSFRWFETPMRRWIAGDAGPWRETRRSATATLNAVPTALIRPRY